METLRAKIVQLSAKPTTAEEAFSLANCLIKNENCFPYTIEDLFDLYHFAADLGHLEAAFYLGCAYAQFDSLGEIEALLKAHLDNFSYHDRIHLSEYYFLVAIDGSHHEAIEELIIAYAYGRGLIKPNVAKFTFLCETLIERGHQSVMLGYGSWLAGMTVDGEEPLSEAIALPLDYARALDYLLMATQGENLALSQHALSLIIVGIKDKLWPTLSEDGLEQKLSQAVNEGNQLLALYFAWYASPEALRGELPELLEKYPFPELAEFVTINKNKALGFVDTVLTGEDSDLILIAKELLFRLFNYQASHDLYEVTEH